MSGKNPVVKDKPKREDGTGRLTASLPKMRDGRMRLAGKWREVTWRAPPLLYPPQRRHTWCLTCISWSLPMTKHKTQFLEQRRTRRGRSGEA